MEELTLAIWMSLVSAELVGREMPGKERAEAPSQLVQHAVHQVPPTVFQDGNLSCFQCFKARSKSQCLPTKCRQGQQVCISHKVVIFTRSKARLLSRRLLSGPLWRGGPPPVPSRQVEATESKRGIILSKRCALRCPNSNSVFEWSPVPGLQARITRRCCSWPLCNVAPAALGGLWALPGGLLLPVALGVIWTLL
ncbi:lymphocyte antigen 6L [Thomomys bottae]